MRTAVTHFDGDPFVTEFWLRLYEKYWRGEVNKIYTDICYNPELVPEPIIEYQRKLFLKYPEITTRWQPSKQIPEISNNQLIPQAEGEVIFLIESDGFIFKKGVVDDCCKKIESGGYDLCSAPFSLIPSGLSEAIQSKGHMRCFMFLNRKLLDQIEIDLMPRKLRRGDKIKGFTDNLDREYDLDCFGWMSLQLTCLKPNTLWTNANLCEPDFWDKSERYENYGWVHVRQMNSSALGYGCKFFEGFIKKDKKVMKEMKKALQGGPAAEWQYIKACAFRLLMLETFPDKEEIWMYYKEYKNTIFEIMEKFKIDFAKVQEIKGYFKGLMRL